MKGGCQGAFAVERDAKSRGIVLSVDETTNLTCGLAFSIIMVCRQLHQNFNIRRGKRNLKIKLDPNANIHVDHFPLAN